MSPGTIAVVLWAFEWKVSLGGAGENTRTWIECADWKALQDAAPPAAAPISPKEKHKLLSLTPALANAIWTRSVAAALGRWQIKNGKGTEADGREYSEDKVETHDLYSAQYA